MARKGYKKLPVEITRATGLTFVPPRQYSLIVRLYQEELAARAKAKAKRKRRQRKKAYEFPPEKPRATRPVPPSRRPPERRRVGGKPLPLPPAIEDVLQEVFRGVADIAAAEVLDNVDHYPFGTDWKGAQVMLEEETTITDQGYRQWMAHLMGLIQSAWLQAGYGGERAIALVRGRALIYDKEHDIIEDHGLGWRTIGAWASLKNIYAEENTFRVLETWNQQMEVLHYKDFLVDIVAIDVSPRGSNRFQPTQEIRKSRR